MMNRKLRLFLSTTTLLLCSANVMAWEPEGEFQRLEKGTQSFEPNDLIAIRLDMPIEESVEIFWNLGIPKYSMKFHANTDAEITILWSDSGKLRHYYVQDKMTVSQESGTYSLTVFVGTHGMIVGASRPNKPLARTSITPIYFGVGSTGRTSLSNYADEIRMELAPWHGEVYKFTPAGGVSIFQQMTAKYSSRVGEFESLGGDAVAAFAAIN